MIVECTILNSIKAGAGILQFELLAINCIHRATSLVLLTINNLYLFVFYLLVYVYLLL